MFIKKLALKLIRSYQKLKIIHHPFLKSLYLTDAVCRFQPTCSEYCYEAIKKYGMIKGSFLGLKRILKCHPWSKGGIDKLK